MRKRNIPLIAYTPVAAGDARAVWLRMQSSAIADNHSAAPWQIILAWAIRDGSIGHPSIKWSKHAVDNVKAADITLTDNN